MNPRFIIAVLSFTVAGLFIGIILNALNIFILNSTSPATIIGKPALEIKKAINTIGEIKTFRSKNKELAKENIELKKDLIFQQEIIEKNLEIQEQLTKAKTIQLESIIPAVVISRSPSKILESVVVNIGKDDGVNIGDPALVDGFLIGIVGETSGGSSRIDLITNPRILLPIKLVTSRADGLMRGSLAGIEITDIPGDTNIENKEGVVTSNINAQILPGIPVGQIEKITSTESDILKRAVVNSPINFNTFEILVILGSNAD